LATSATTTIAITTTPATTVARIARLRRSCRRLAAAFLAEPVGRLPPAGLPEPPFGRPAPGCCLPVPGGCLPVPGCGLVAGRPDGRLPPEPVAPRSVPRSSIRSFLLGRWAPHAPSRDSRRSGAADTNRSASVHRAYTATRAFRLGSRGTWTSRAAVARR
jgi:hypothetical protein